MSRPADEQALSNVISFSLMFAIIIVSVGLVSLTGLSQVTTLSEAEEIHNAEHGLESTAATLEGMNQYGDVNRTFSLSFVNGHIWMNETTLNVTSEDGWNEYESLTINSLEYRFDRSNTDVSVRYESGGVFRSDGASPDYQPTFACRGGDVALISVVNLTLDESLGGLYVGHGYDPDVRLNEFAASGDAPISNADEVLNFRANLIETERNLTRNATIVVNANDTAGPDQWDFYFQDLANGDSAWERTNDGEIRCEADRVLVQVSTIELEIVDPQFGS